MITTLIVALTVIYLAERARPLVVRWMNGRGKTAPQVKLPQDLQRLADAERQPWARDDAAKRFLELFEEQGHDWDRVRAVTTGAEHGSTTGH